MRDARAVDEKRRRSQAEAESLVQDFEQSGLNRKAFCSARGVALHTLDYYRAPYRIVKTPQARLVLEEIAISLLLDLRNKLPIKAAFEFAEYAKPRLSG